MLKFYILTKRFPEPWDPNDGGWFCGLGRHTFGRFYEESYGDSDEPPAQAAISFTLNFVY